MTKEGIYIFGQERRACLVAQPSCFVATAVAILTAGTAGCLPAPVESLISLLIADGIASAATRVYHFIRISRTFAELCEEPDIYFKEEGKYVSRGPKTPLTNLANYLDLSRKVL